MKPQVIAVQLTIAGLVQGIGMRPAIARLAEQFAIKGYVKNSPQGVKAHVEGDSMDVQRFRESLPTALPRSARIDAVEWIPADLRRFPNFAVRELLDASDRTTGSPKEKSPLATQVPVDRVVCSLCLKEAQQEGNRRYNYPLISCTECGPRYSIIRKMPFERQDTTMESFPLCSCCATENESAVDRRFHCQTTACSTCGPGIWLRNFNDQILGTGDQSLILASQALLSGKILALRGLGGYQLLADATCDKTVSELRRRKKRPGKPLAVLIGSLAQACSLAELNPIEKTELQSPAGPVVIAKRLFNADLAPSIFNGLNTIGLMLPTTSLHWMLWDLCQRPLVCTSANSSGQPLVYRQENALAELGDIADVWLEHDRPIERPLDDSVVRVIAGRSTTIRLARGLAPLRLPIETEVALTAYGGHQKAAVAISNGCQSVLGPYVGDLDTVANCDRYNAQLGSFEELYRIEPDGITCDQHPEYYSTQRSLHRSKNNDKPIDQVQHHHAHIVAAMVDNEFLEQQVLGISFDGTGLGPDSTIWGGEFLVATAEKFKRVGCLRPLRLVGGELANRQAWRCAVSVVLDAVEDERSGIESLGRLGFGLSEIRKLAKVWHKPGLTSLTSSAGRLFDSVAALALGIESNTYEGEAAMLLESACDPDEMGEYGFLIEEDEEGFVQVDWRPVIRQILLDLSNQISASRIAMRFHRGIAAAIIDLCRRFPHLPVVLGGGVFQNRIVVELVAERLQAMGRKVGLPGKIPVNDGGLAAGQLAIAAKRWKRK